MSEHAHRLDLPPQWKFSIPVDRHYLDSIRKISGFLVQTCRERFGNDSEAVVESILGDTALISY